MSDFKTDRGSQFLLAALPDLSLQDARLVLDRAAIEVVLDPDVGRTAWAQACAMAIVTCGSKMFRRGVYFRGEIPRATVIGNRLPHEFRRVLLDNGCRLEPPPEHATRICIGHSAQADIFATARGWRAAVGPKPAESGLPGNELSGIFAGALAVSVAFRKSVMRDLTAGRKMLEYNLWWPGGTSPDDARLRGLPADLWLLGAGNLGQATILTLGLLPYADPADVRLLLNDPDVCGWENLGVQLLSKPGWIGRKKARCVAEWAENVGFRTVICERKFQEWTKPDKDEPRFALVGVDNLEARRLAASAGFDLLIDAGLGATASEAFDVRLHTFPGSRDALKIWPEPDSIEGAGSEIERDNLRALVRAGVTDQCGAITIENQPVGVPCTALATAAVQVAQACRAVETGECCEFIDFDLLSANRTRGEGLSRPTRPVERALVRID